jgi:NAD(P)-dependent dehydrogenase (short-subunit alcohol dehydrogenase family)
VGLLEGKVALVTGASRGIGKGTAIALSREGATVYITGRTKVESENATGLSGSLETTVAEIEAFGGKCVAIACDHTDDRDTERVFRKIAEDGNGLDILVNCAWGGYEHFTDGTEFWKEKGFWDMPFARWDKMFDSGVRAHFVASSLACGVMIPRRRGLIVNLSFWAAERNDKGAAYSAAKAATNKMTECMAYELRDTGVSAVTLYPGLVRTESVMKSQDFFDMGNSESTEFTGRVVCALYNDANLTGKSGRRMTSAELAIEYGIADVDGKRPRPLTAADC